MRILLSTVDGRLLLVTVPGPIGLNLEEMRVANSIDRKREQMRRWRRSPQDRAWLLRRAGYKNYEIARILGVCRKTVYLWLKKNIRAAACHGAAGAGRGGWPEAGGWLPSRGNRPRLQRHFKV